MDKVFILRELFDEGRSGYADLGYYSSSKKAREAMDRYLEKHPEADLGYFVAHVDEAKYLSYFHIDERLK